MDRENTLKLLQKFVKTETLMKHLLAVEAVMRAYARKLEGDEEEWGIAGLLHDFDWEIVPSAEAHPTYGASILREMGYPEHIVRAVLSHGDHTDIQRESLMERTLFAVAELSGFIRAVTLVRPSKSLDDVTPKSVKKKMKDKAFARDVRREDITRGAEELEVDLEEHMTFVIEGLKPVAKELGLKTGQGGGIGVS